MSTRRVSVRLFVVLALAVAVGLGAFVSPYASSSPDGLEKVAETYEEQVETAIRLPLR